MFGERREMHHTEESLSYDRLKQAILASVREGRGVVESAERAPVQIDVGKFGERALACARMTQEDDKKRERGAAIILGRDGELKVQREEGLDVGSEETPEVKISAEKKDLSVVGDIHSHPDRQPFSETDLLRFVWFTRKPHISLVAGSDGLIRALVKAGDTRYFPGDTLGDIERTYVKGLNFFDLWKKECADAEKRVRPQKFTDLQREADALDGLLENEEDEETRHKLLLRGLELVDLQLGEYEEDMVIQQHDRAIAFLAEKYNFVFYRAKQVGSTVLERVVTKF